MDTTIEDWIAQIKNLKPVCEKIRGKKIAPRTWYEWEVLAGAAYPQGVKVKNRKYTDEQTRLLLCLAWWRRTSPGVAATYTTLRNYHNGNVYKIEEVYDFCCQGGEMPPPPPEAKTVQLKKIKTCCDAIAGKAISRDTWSKWKRHLGIPDRTKAVEEGQGALLVYMACWRNDNPNKPFPSVKRLVVMMHNNSRQAMTIETSSSSRRQFHWEMYGCTGKELPKYLAAHGYRVSLYMLYRWGKGQFSQRKHYTVVDLAMWKRIAQEKLWQEQTAV